MNDKEFARRLEILERDNRRLKRVAAAGIALAAALSIIYTISCSMGRNSLVVKPGAEKIAAREFDVVDSAGKVRIQMAVTCLPTANCQPSIKMFDQGGKAATSFGVGSLTVSSGDEEASLLGGHLQFSEAAKGSAPRVTAELGSGAGGGGLLSLAGKDGGYVIANADSPNIELKDFRGYLMDLGAVDLTTVVSGQSSQTTADSIVMFGSDNKHHLIWRAP
ncbi:MAG: hypothetical protein EPN47_12675 [Acidobacteria bacterium]|nr:MAG: hypothetical protein EPN47_12675 [Acidobacteriota bacterium]